MKKKCFSLFVIAVLFALPTSAQWTQTVGPYANTTVNCLATDGSLLFTGTENSGIYLSSNFGANWGMASGGLSIYGFNDLLLDGSNLFAAGDNGLYRSTNNGNSWTNVQGGSFYSSCAIVVKGTTFIASSNGAIYRSTNNGSSWTSVSSLTNATLAVSGSDFVAATSTGVYTSSDDGLTWTLVNASQTNIQNLKANGSNLYAGTTAAIVGVGRGVLLSTDNGATWTTQNTGFTGTSVTSFLLNGTDMYCGSSVGMFLSTNSGSSWSAVSGTNTYSISSMEIMGATLFLGTYNSGIYSSTNFGASWTSSYSGLITSDVRALGFNGSNLFGGGNGSGAYLTSNNGANWTQINSGLSNLTVNTYASIGINTFAGTNGGVFLSTNNGASWSVVNTGLTNLAVEELVVIGSNLFAGTYGGGVFLSSNNGASWTPVNSGLSDLQVTTLTANGSNLFAGTNGSGVFLSTNNGASWTAVNNGFTPEWTYSLTSSGGNVYSIEGFSNNIYKTTDNGSSWTLINNGASGSRYTIYASGSNLFAFGSQMNISTDGGSTWNNITTGLPSINKYGFAVNGNSLYVGTTGLGVWKRNLDEILCSINPPVMSSASAISICSGSAINIPLSNTGVSATYTWVASDNIQTTGESTSLQTTSTINNTITNNSNVNTATLTYTVTPIGVSGGCVGATQTVTVTVDPLPVMTSNSSITICSGQSVGLSLASSVASSYDWYASDNVNATGESTSLQSSGVISDVIINNSLVPETITYTVTPISINGNCTGAPQTVTVTVNPTPVMLSASEDTICSGGTVTVVLNSDVASNYTWNAANNVNTSGESISTQFGNTLSNTISNNTSISQDVTYTVIPTSVIGGCSGLAQTVVVTVHPEPVLISSTNATICSGSALNLSLISNIPSTFDWVAADNVNTTGESLTNQTGNSISNTITNNSSFVQNVLYTVTPTSTTGGCVGGNQTISVLINPLDNAGFSYSSSTYCKSGPNPSAIVTGLSGGYFSSTSGLVFANAYSGLINLSSSTVGSYTVTYTTNNVCPNTATFNITITTAPIASFSYAGTPYCSGATNPLPTFGLNASGGVFSANPAGLAFVSTVTGEINLTTSTPGTYTITNYIAASGGCASDVATSTIIINPLPVVSFTGLATNYYYNDPAVTLVGSPSGGTFSGTAVSGNSFNPSIAGGGIFPITYSYTDLNGCSNTSIDSTTVLAQPAPPDICEVTVDSASVYNNIYWDKTQYSKVDSFIVYREITNNVYKRIGAIKDTALSLFVDTVRTLYFPNTGNPNSGTYRYKLQIRDSLGNYSPLSPYHNTIYIQKSFGTFSWNHYQIEGQTVPLPANTLITYDLYRDDLSNGNWQIVNSVTGSQQTQTDVGWNTSLENTASWRVMTNWTIGCTATRGSINKSRSNIKRIALVSVEQQMMDNLIAVYPNPAYDLVTIECPLGLNKYHVQLFNAFGQVVYDKQLADDGTNNTVFKHQINIAAFTKGVYFISISTEAGRTMKRLIVQ